MRYKSLIESKLENLSNSLNTLNHMVYQGTTKEKVDEWFVIVKEKIDDIKTLINSESDNAAGTW